MNVTLLLLTLLHPYAMDVGDSAQVNSGRLLIDEDDSIADGRNALNGWFGYPWYDAQNDGVRRVDVAEPWNADLSFLGQLLQGLAWVVIGLLLAGVAYLLVRAYLRRQDRGPLDRPQPLGGAERIDALPLPADRARRDLLEEARRQYEAGNYALAIVYLFGFQLVQLDRRQIIRLERGKTNRQYLREVGPRQGLRGLVEQTMLCFEDVFFGHRTLDRTRFETCWRRLDEFATLTQ